MKLLIVTQKVDRNDPVLGFFHRWIVEFAKHCESIIVICLYKGEHNLPKNVRVLSLGKEKYFQKEARHQRGAKRRERSFLKEKIFSRARYTIRFYKLIFRERNNYDTVFVHMNPIYVNLGAFLWRLWGKKIGLWYAHGHVPLSLRFAEKLTDIVFTSTESGFRLPSKKVRVMGQGIDVEKFKVRDAGRMDSNRRLRIVTVGRISPVKDYETLLRAAEILAKDGIEFTLKIIGDVGVQKQEAYLKKLKSEAKRMGLVEQVVFTGAVLNDQILNYLDHADLFVNTSRTGSLDKAILEAMAAGLPVVTCNEAAYGVLSGYREICTCPEGDADTMAKKIKRISLMDRAARRELGEALHEIVAAEHSMEKFIERVCGVYAGK